MNWQEHVAIVTGAGSGIGKAIAERFAEEGAKVVVAEVNAERGEAVAAAIRKQSGTAQAFCVDVSKADACRALIHFTMETFGHIDTLVNNAGVNFVMPTLQMEEADWDRVLDVDLKGAFLCSRYALEAMVPRRSGSIINIASVHSYATLAEAAPYAAAKWGVVGMTKGLAVEFAAQGIRVNAVSPGLTDTQIWQDIIQAADDREALLQHWDDNIPMGRVQDAREVANLVLFLASDQATYITGSNIITDGGMTSQLISRARYASKALEGKIDA